MRSFLLLALVACSSSKSDPSESGALDTSGGDTSLTLDVPAPCSSGTWGSADEATAAASWHVHEGASGGGSAEAPFASIQEAIEATRADGASKSIVVWPGRYVASLDLGGSDLGDVGLRLLGCGTDDVTIEGDAATSPVVRLSTAASVEVAGVTLTGGRRGVLAWQGSALTLRDVVADQTGRVGIVIDGSSSVATLDRVRVLNPSIEGSSAAYGIAVQNGALTATDLEVSGAGTAGIVIDGSSSIVSLNRVSVADTSVAADGRFGRGIQIQGQASVAIANANLVRNHDAGIFALQAMSVRLEAVDVSETLAAGIAPAGLRDVDAGTSADGITITDGAPDESWAERYFSAELVSVTVDAPGRAGVLLSGDGLSAVLGTIDIGAAGYDPGAGLPIVQDGAAATGAAVYTIDAANALRFNADTLTSDDPAL